MRRKDRKTGPNPFIFERRCCGNRHGRCSSSPRPNDGAGESGPSKESRQILPLSGPLYVVNVGAKAPWWNRASLLINPTQRGRENRRYVSFQGRSGTC